jgi:heterodisulfide reductase subunit C
MMEIDLNQADPEFRKALMQQPGSEKIAACFACHTCQASCPVAPVNERFNPLKVIRMALYGLKKEVLESDFIWFCSSCYACQERCPQGVRITDIMTILKNLAMQTGHAPAGVKTQWEIITKQGRIYPIDDFDNKKREKINLPALPTACEKIKELFP